MQPRSVQATVLAVEVAALVLVLAVLGVVHTELAVGVERIRLMVTRPTHVGLTSVWTFAAALTLPFAFAAGVAVIVQGYGWLRSGEASAPLYTHVYSTASVVLACGAASAVAAAAGGLASVVIPAALLVYTAVTRLLIAAVVALTVAAPRDA